MDSGYLKEKIAYANRKIEESCRGGEGYEIEYWVGYKDGLLAVLRDLLAKENGG